MGVYVKIKNVAFKNYIGIAEIEEEPIVPDVPDEPTAPETYPVSDNLKGLYYLSGSQDNSVVDQSGNGNDATVEGEGVTFADGYAHFTGDPVANRISTPFVIAPETGATLVAMFRVPTGERVLLSNYKYMSGGFNFSNARVYISATENDGSKTFSAVGRNGFAICALYIDADYCRVAKYSNGAISEIRSVTAPMVMKNVNVCIGGGTSGAGMVGDADIAFVSIHEGNVTDEQLQQIFEYLKKYGESNGLTIE